MTQPLACGSFYPLSPCPTPIDPVQTTQPPPPGTAATGAPGSILEPTAAGLVLALLGAAALAGARRRKGKA